MINVPVPLTDIEAAKEWAGTLRPGYVILNTPQRDALCEALRIAVEGLELWNGEAEADVRLAAVRELVDLGEKP